VSELAQVRAGAPIALASRSPQRRAILQSAGIPFTVVESGYEEGDLPGASARDVAVTHARGKAEGASVAAGTVVAGIDTVVDVDDRVLEKPAGRAQAREFLAELSGRKHRVHSGVHTILGERTHTACVTTVVRFAKLSGADIDWYLETEEWRGRAGGYAIQEQGAVLVAMVEGDYLNVVGLPLRSLVHGVIAVRG
jgi:septum formation protein